MNAPRRPPTTDDSGLPADPDVLVEYLARLGAMPPAELARVIEEGKRDGSAKVQRFFEALDRELKRNAQR